MFFLVIFVIPGSVVVSGSSSVVVVVGASVVVTGASVVVVVGASVVVTGASVVVVVGEPLQLATRSSYSHLIVRKHKLVKDHLSQF